MGQIDDLKTELDTDPLTIGYSGMTDEEVATAMNRTDTGRTLPVDELTSQVLYGLIDTTEFDALSAGNKADVDRVLSVAPAVTLSPGSRARAVLTSIFGGGSTTSANIGAAVVRTVSRAEEIGLGVVKVGHVQQARAL